VGNEARLIYATMSPFESTDVALKVSERLGIPWVADLRDPWALDEFAIYPTLLHRKLDKWKMERVLSTAALIIMNTPEATKALKEAFPRLHTKSIITITNGFDQEDFATGIPARRDSKFRIVHSGGFATDLGLHLRRRFYYPLLGGCVPGLDMLTRSPWFLLKALERWCDQRPAAVNDLEIVFAGKTLREDLALVHQSRIANSIRLPGYVSHAQSLELIRTADLLFLPMHNLPPGKRSRTIQAKTYEYLASGRPILAAVPDGDAGDFLRQSGSAFVCRPDDVAGMILILDKAYAAWRQGQPLTFSNSEFVAQFEHRNLTQTLANGFRKVLEEC
jgi:glycosyltransferase involved in cell wall biosynthesis